MDYTSSAPTPSAAATNIFDDLDAVRINPTDALQSVSEIITTIPVRKPSRHEFFRICPDPTMSLVTGVYIDKQDRDTTYFVAPAMRGALFGEDRIAVLHHFVTREGVSGIWPVTLPGDERQCNWTDSKRIAIERAKQTWVRIAGDMPLGAYRIFEARGEFGDPRFSTMTFSEMLKIAFKGRVIDTEDHPIVKRLLGI